MFYSFNKIKIVVTVYIFITTLVDVTCKGEAQAKFASCTLLYKHNIFVLTTY